MTTAARIGKDGETAIASFSRRYSRFVGLMKLVLPAFALGLVVLIAAWPGRFGGGEGFRMSFADLAPDPDGALGVVRARFAGTDAGGRPFLITADRAVQQTARFDTFSLETLQADMTLDNGTWVSVSAIGGVFDRDGRQLQLEGPIDVFTDAGYEFHAAAAEIDLERGIVETTARVRGHGPLGAIEAGGMRFSGDGGVISFSGGVRVVLNGSR
ncbi:MAG: LPS export ABC transporter periplasmic protein LptC [Proteobacteria bacterium]|nr:LPS export ABC transporter periplasmic protein LptC [Pseudomonadota bacterium]MDA1132152.1 LPS export ABC transporter periplasmic protein LptC [Pseudomonadota bacterium]